VSDPQFWLGLTTGLLAAALLVLMVALLPFLQQLQRTATAAERLLNILERELPTVLGNVRDTTGELKDVTSELDTGLKRVNKAADAVGSGVTVAQKQLSGLSLQARALWAGAGTAWQVLIRRD